MNLVFKATDFAQQAVVRGIENINVSIDAFDGTAASFDAINVQGATITLSSAKLGFNGTAGVKDAGANNVTAGANVTKSLTVTGLTTGVVNAGASKVVAVTTKEDTDVANITVNGDLELTVNEAEEAVVKATADSKIDFFGAQLEKLTVTGAGNVTVLAGHLGGEEIVNGLTSGNLVAVVEGAEANVGKWDVDAIQVEADAALTEVAAAPVELTKANLTVSAAGESAASSNVAISTALNQTSITVTDAKTAEINITAAATVGTVEIGQAAVGDVAAQKIDTTINVAGNTTITTLTANGSDVVIVGTGDVIITNATDAASIDASGLTGKLVVESNAEATILGGSGDNEVTVSDHDTSYIGQSGKDAVTVAAGFGATFAAQLGGGDDTLQLSGAIDGDIAVEFGAGTDKIVLAADTSLLAANLSVTGLEVIEVANTIVGGVADETQVVMAARETLKKTS